MNARLFITRHGSTDLNSGSTNTEKFRGWADIPLNEEGIQDAHKAGAFLQDKGISHIFASDLGRTMDTAGVIHQYTHAPITPVHGLRPWNLGEFTGKPVEPNKKTVEEFQNNPDKPIPGGESYNQFLHRWNTTLHHLTMFSAQQGKPIALVTHTRDVNALKAQVEGHKGSVPVDSMTAPGGIVRMDVIGGKVKLTDEELGEGIKSESRHFQE